MALLRLPYVQVSFKDFFPDQGNNHVVSAHWPTHVFGQGEGRGALVASVSGAVWTMSREYQSVLAPPHTPEQVFLEKKRM